MSRQHPAAFRAIITTCRNVFASIQLGEFVRVALSYPIIGLGFIIWSQLTPSVLARRKAFMGYTGDKVEARKEQASGQQDFIEHVRYPNALV